MKLFEYQSKALLEQWNLPIPRRVFVDRVENISSALKAYGSDKGVLKAQVLTGGRGKAGGIKTFQNQEDARILAVDMFGKKLVTKQTGEAGILINAITIDEWTVIKDEIYVAVLIDRAKSNRVIMISTQGGMNIEDVAEHTPELIHHLYPPIDRALELADLKSLNNLMKMTNVRFKEFCEIVMMLYDAFLKLDASLIEINPLAIDENDQFQVVDCKMDIDENALFRQADISKLPNPEFSKAELEAAEYGLNYIPLEGNIGCMVNGAGLAMSTMDTIKYCGGSPANFLDVGGSASEAAITKAFDIITSDPNVKAILVNIFGGIMHCDIIAKGIITAFHQSDIDLPLVVRLEGTNSEEGRRLINHSGLKIETASTIDEASKKVIALTV